MPPNAVELTGSALVHLVQDIKGLNAALNAGRGVIKLNCPCGAAVVAATLVLPGLKDRQRGHIKSRVERHLRGDHRLSQQTVRLVLNDSLAQD